MKIFSNILRTFKVSRRESCKITNRRYSSQLCPRICVRSFTTSGSSKNTRSIDGSEKNSSTPIIPVAFLNAQNADGPLKILVIPINMVGGDAETVQRTVSSTMFALRTHAEQIDAFTENAAVTLDKPNISNSKCSNDAAVSRKMQDSLWEDIDVKANKFSDNIFDEIDETHSPGWAPNTRHILSDVPEKLKKSLGEAAISSMSLAFEMDMTNLKDALMTRSLEMDQQMSSKLEDPTLAFKTGIQSDSVQSSETIPLNFNALIHGTVNIDSSKMTPEKLEEIEIPQFNDYVTTIAANICSTALQKGFPADISRMYSTKSSESPRSPNVVCVKTGDKGCISPGNSHLDPYIPKGQKGTSVQQKKDDDDTCKEFTASEPSCTLLTSTIIGDLGARGLMSCQAYSRAVKEAARLRECAKKAKNAKNAASKDEEEKDDKKKPCDPPLPCGPPKQDSMCKSRTLKEPEVRPSLSNPCRPQEAPCNKRAASTGQSKYVPIDRSMEMAISQILAASDSDPPCKKLPYKCPQPPPKKKEEKIEDDDPCRAMYPDKCPPSTGRGNCKAPIYDPCKEQNKCVPEKKKEDPKNLPCDYDPCKKAGGATVPLYIPEEFRPELKTVLASVSAENGQQNGAEKKAEPSIFVANNQEASESVGKSSEPSIFAESSKNGAEVKAESPKNGAEKKPSSGSEKKLSSPNCAKRPGAAIKVESAKCEAAEIKAEPLQSSAAEIKAEPPHVDAAEIKAEAPHVEAAEIKADAPCLDAAEVKAEAAPHVDVAEVKAEAAPHVDVAEVKAEAAPHVDVAEVKAEAAPRVDVAEVKAEAAPRVDVAEVKAEAAPCIDAAEVKAEAPCIDAAEVKAEAPCIDAAEVKAEAPCIDAAEVKAEAPHVDAAEVKAEAPHVDAAEIKAEPPKNDAAEMKAEPRKCTEGKIPAGSQKQDFVLYTKPTAPNCAQKRAKNSGSNCEANTNPNSGNGKEPKEESLATLAAEIESSVKKDEKLHLMNHGTSDKSLHLTKRNADLSFPTKYEFLEKRKAPRKCEPESFDYPSADKTKLSETEENKISDGTLKCPERPILPLRDTKPTNEQRFFSTHISKNAYSVLSDGAFSTMSSPYLGRLNFFSSHKDEESPTCPRAPPRPANRKTVTRESTDCFAQDRLDDPCHRPPPKDPKDTACHKKPEPKQCWETDKENKLWRYRTDLLKIPRNRVRVTQERCLSRSCPQMQNQNKTELKVYENEIFQQPSTKDITNEIINDVIRIGAAGEVLHVREKIEHLSDYDVLIRMAAIAISGSDIHVYETGSDKCEGITLGHDATGVVERAGKCVDRLKPGDCVVMESGLSCGICDVCKSGSYNMCPQLFYNGFFSTYQTHPADMCHKIPKNLTIEDATLTPTLASACQACFKAHITPVATVLIIGTCAKSCAAALCARALGAKSVAILSPNVHTLESIRILFDLDYIHYYHDEPNKLETVTERVCSVLRDRPNVIINYSINESTMNLATNLLKSSGVCVLAECDQEHAKINAMDVIMKNISLVPSFRSASMFPTALHLMKSGKTPIGELVSRIYTWDQIRWAFHWAQYESNMGNRKVVVQCPEI